MTGAEAAAADSHDLDEVVSIKASRLPNSAATSCMRSGRRCQHIPLAEQVYHLTEQVCHPHLQAFLFTLWPRPFRLLSVCLLESLMPIRFKAVVSVCRTCIMISFLQDNCNVK